MPSMSRVMTVNRHVTISITKYYSYNLSIFRKYNIIYLFIYLSDYHDPLYQSTQNNQINKFMTAN